MISTLLTMGVKKPLGKGNKSKAQDKETQIIRQCALCETEYDQKGIKTIEKKEGVSLMHCTCKTCHGAVLVLLASTPVGVTSVGMITDLTVKDIKQLKGKAPITEDDVLAFHQFVQQKQPSFLKYISDS